MNTCGLTVGGFSLQAAYSSGEVKQQSLVPETTFEDIVAEAQPEERIRNTRKSTTSFSVL